MNRTATYTALGLASIVGMIALGTSSCGSMDKISEPFNDAPRAREFSQPADVITMPDGFSNLATKCGPGQMRYTVVFHQDGPYGSVAVTPDPSCPK